MVQEMTERDGPSNEQGNKGLRWSHGTACGPTSIGPNESIASHVERFTPLRLGVI